MSIYRKPIFDDTNFLTYIVIENIEHYTILCNTLSGEYGFVMNEGVDFPKGSIIENEQIQPLYQLPTKVYEQVVAML